MSKVRKNRWPDWESPPTVEKQIDNEWWTLGGHSGGEGHIVVEELTGEKDPVSPAPDGKVTMLQESLPKL